MEVKLLEMLFSVAATLLGAIAVGILKHISVKIDRANNRHRLMGYKQDALVHTLSEEIGNGFRKKYDIKLINMMKEDDFIYKEVG